MSLGDPAGIQACDLMIASVRGESVRHEDVEGQAMGTENGWEQIAIETGHVNGQVSVTEVAPVCLQASTTKVAPAWCSSVRTIAVHCTNGQISAMKVAPVPRVSVQAIGVEG